MNKYYKLLFYTNKEIEKSVDTFVQESAVGQRNFMCLNNVEYETMANVSTTLLQLFCIAVLEVLW